VSLSLDLRFIPLPVFQWRIYSPCGRTSTTRCILSRLTKEGRKSRRDQSADIQSPRTTSKAEINGKLTLDGIFFSLGVAASQCKVCHAGGTPILQYSTASSCLTGRCDGRGSLSGGKQLLDGCQQDTSSAPPLSASLDSKSVR
jgi:hypothetical protein